MSYDQLRAVETTRALEPTHRFEDLLLYHVAFDELNGEPGTEAMLARLLATGGRVVVIGESGSGKSSVIAAVLGPLSVMLPERILPLRVPVAAEVDRTVSEPGLLARHIVRFVTRWATQERFSPAEQADLRRGGDISRRAGSSEVRTYHVGLPLWMANADLAHEVRETGEAYEERGSSSEAIEQLRRMVALFGSHDLWPVFVFDDSDTWVRIPGSDRSKVANAFFLRGVRMLAKELDAGLVLAVHDTYLGLTGYREASALLTGEVRIPRLRAPEAGLHRILEHRFAVAEVPADVGEVLHPAGLAALARYYDSGRGIREVLRVAQRSFQNALSDREEAVTPPLVAQAIAEFRH